jgi:hypothetical protein
MIRLLCIEQASHVRYKPHGRWTMGAPMAEDVDNAALVRRFLRGQNLEQVGRVEEAVRVYEEVIGEAFDSTGPYDRLIALYADQARHADVERVAGSALARVRTHEAKRAWYERVRSDARKASGTIPRAAPKRPT